MGFGTIIILIIVAGVAIAIAQLITQSKAREAMSTAMSTSGFRAHQQFMSADARTGLGINSFEATACLTVAGGAPRLIRFQDLLEVEIQEDGQTITKTQNTSQVGRALVGGVLLGPVGALAGALTAKKSSIAKTRRIDLRLVIADATSPVHTLNFLDHPNGVEKSSLTYRQAREKAEHWYGAITACIRQAEQAAPPLPAPSPPQASTPSVADELQKLADLRTRGILTDAEFAEQKAVVLQRS
jgi:hypothetical protein